MKRLFLALGVVLCGMVMMAGTAVVASSAEAAKDKVIRENAALAFDFVFTTIPVTFNDGVEQTTVDGSTSSANLKATPIFTTFDFTSFFNLGVFVVEYQTECLSVEDNVAINWVRTRTNWIGGSAGDLIINQIVDDGTAPGADSIVGRNVTIWDGITQIPDGNAEIPGVQCSQDQASLLIGDGNSVLQVGSGFRLKDGV